MSINDYNIVRLGFICFFGSYCYTFTFPRFLALTAPKMRARGIELAVGLLCVLCMPCLICECQHLCVLHYISGNLSRTASIFLDGYDSYL